MRWRAWEGEWMIKISEEHLKLKGERDSAYYTALSLVFSTNVVCVKTQQKHCSIKHHDKTKE